MTSLQTEAVKYTTLGWGVIRLHHVLDDGSCSCKRAECSSIGKHPLDPKGASLPEHDYEKVQHLWEQTPNANIGIVAGTSNLLILDFDSDEARERFKQIADQDTLELLRRNPIVKTGRGYHVYLEDPTGGYSPSVGSNGDTGIDIRAGVSYVVAPPSNHANGNDYTWAQYPKNPPQPPTPWLDAYIRNRYDKPVRVYEDGDKIITGGRNKELASLAGTMRRRGFTEGAIRAALLEENEKRVDPPLSTHEVEGIARSIAKKAPQDVPLDNNRHDLATVVAEIEERGDEAKYKFLNLDEINALPDIQYLVDGLLPLNGYGIVYGRRGSGKTFEMLHLSLCIATGKAYRGHKVQQGGVAYIMSEGAAGLKKRIAAWMKHHQVDQLENFYALTHSVQLNDPELRAHLDLAIERIPADVQLLVIDTLARSVSGLDENSSADMTRFIGYVDEIRLRRSLAVVPVHHAGWNDGHERGSTVIGDAADWICKVAKEDDNIIVKTEKVKDDELPEPLRLNLVPIDGTGSVVLEEADEETIKDKLVEEIIKIVETASSITEKNLLKLLAESNIKASQNTIRNRIERSPGTFKYKRVERVEGTAPDKNGTLRACMIWRIKPAEISTIGSAEQSFDTSFADDEEAA
jgi:hypothetical protein